MVSIEHNWNASVERTTTYAAVHDSLQVATCECGYQQVFSRQAYLAGKVILDKYCPECGRELV